jgi:TolB-like protein
VQFFFEDHELDVDRRELTRGSERIALEPQVFDLLVYLVQNRDRVVSKDELIERVWEGRIVSESTLTSRITAVRKAIGDSGDAQRLIRTVSRKGIRFVGAVKDKPQPVAVGKVAAQPTTDNAPAATGPTLALPDRPSIAVLPFQNMSGDSEQEYFADGMVEEIIIALSRIRSLMVIARNSSFIYKGQSVDVKQVGRDLGVRYVLEGSVRKSRSQVRITGQLIEASSGAHLWADRFDGSLEDIFDLQDQVTSHVVGAIAPKLEQAEIERVKRKPTDSLDAHECFLRGMASYYLRTSEAISEALRLYYKAIECDPDFASAYGMAAWCYGMRKSYGWVIDRAEEIAEAARLGRRAAELGEDDAVALSRGAHALAFVVGDLDVSATMADRALALNPNLAGAWYASGWVRAYRGESDVAITHLARAMRLNPLDPHTAALQAGTAFAHFLAGRYDEALRWAERASSTRPNFKTSMIITAASSALTGQLAEAQKAMSRLRGLDPAMRVADIRDWAPLRRQDDLEMLEDVLRKAGLPET